ncbi:MAG: photosynthetic reaction center subunit H [Woeseiaceae bacterium]|nr:photosynthetic reaction center subunit H [Woeseiaceae bacterium]
MSSGLASIDLVEVLFTLFWVFFIGLVYYMQREMKREGYPLVSDRSEHITVQGFPAMPSPKEFHLDDGRVVLAPRQEAPETHYSSEPAAPHPGAPINPSGDALKAGVGPGAWANRSEVIEKTLEGTPRIVPMRANAALHVDEKCTDPRGMTVIAADGKSVGKVSDLWIDLAEPQIYFLEVSGESGSTMVPFGFAEIDKAGGQIRVNAIYSSQWSGVPRIASPDQITPREEDQIMGYFGGGLLLADDQRAEPFF